MENKFTNKILKTFLSFSLAFFMSLFSFQGFAQCTSGLGANQEGFETAGANFFQGPWTSWSLDAASSSFTGTNAWRSLSGSTGSFGTGPTGPSEGNYYVYCETSGQYNRVANLVSSCVDLSNFTDPAFLFSYHMYGATMGSLNVDLSTDSGSTWTNLWTLSGDQGNQWNDGVVDLAQYSSNIVQLRMSYTSGTSFTGDCGIDDLRFMELPLVGCMDSSASNYDPTATIDDGSCLYPGCMDQNALNYSSIFNVMDSASCIYPACNSIPLTEDWESGSSATNSWLLSAGTEAHVALTDTASTSVNAPTPLSGTWSLEMSGGSSVGYGSTPYNEAAAFDASKSSHFGTATICLDLSAYSSNVALSALVSFNDYYTSPYSWLRVRKDSTVLQELASGNTSFTNSSLSNITGNVSTGMSTTGSVISFDLSAYAGQSEVRVTFESACKYGPSYANGAYQGMILVDDISVSTVSLGCTDPFANNYDSTATVDDGSCIYVGCTDALANNYCATCNQNDPSLCTYNACSTLPFTDGFEAYNLTGTWVTTSGSSSSINLVTSNTLVDTVSLESTGGDSFKPTYTTEATAFASTNASHITTASLCLDLSSVSNASLSFQAELAGFYTNTSWLRVRIDTNVLQEASGATAFVGPAPVATFNYDLSAYAGQSAVYVVFESMVNYNSNYSVVVLMVIL